MQKCSPVKVCKNRFPNITIKKIPQMLLNRCEFNRDDYSLNIVNLPHEETAEPKEEYFDTIETVQEIRDKQGDESTQQSLF